MKAFRTSSARTSALTLVAAFAVAVGTATCNSSPGASSGVDAYCSRLSTFVRECAVSDACIQAELTDCPAIEASLSAAHVGAAGACPLSCDGGSCFFQRFLAASPSAAQQQVQDDFCKQCTDGADPLDAHACSQFFFTAADSSTGAGVGMGGLTVLEYNDAIAARIDQQCTGASVDSGQAGCAETFYDCADAVIRAKAYFPPACEQAAGDE